MIRRLVLLLSVLTVNCTQGTERVVRPPELSDGTLANVTKVFSLITDTQKEYEVLLTQATYPNDEVKTRAKLWIKQKQLFYEILRVRYAECLDKRSRASLLAFVERATGFVDVPEAVFTHWDLKSGNQKLANLSRTESLRDDFYVMAAALVKDVK